MNGGGWKCSDSHAVLPGGVSALLSNFLPLPHSQAYTPCASQEHMDKTRAHPVTPSTKPLTIRRNPVRKHFGLCVASR